MRRGDLIVFLAILVFFGGGVFMSAHAVDVPTNFTVTATSSCAIELNWGGTTSNYNIERDGVVEDGIAPGGTSPYVLIDSHDSALWGGASVDPIDPGAGNSYRIRAYNPITGQYSSWTGSQSATTNALPAQPGAPTGLGLTVNDTNGNITVSWIAGSASPLFADYGFFEVWEATSADGSLYGSFSLLDGAVPSDRLFYEVTGNNRDASYQYKLKAREVGGFGCDPSRPEHTVASADSSVITVPVRPSGFNVQFIESPRKISVVWTDVQTSPNETSIELQRSLTSDFISPVTYSPAVDTEVYDDTDISATGSQTYYYRVRSCINTICSFWSDPVSATTGVPVPGNVSARIVYTNLSAGTILLFWDEENILSGSQLNIERAEDDGSFSVITSLSPTDTARQNRRYQENRPTGLVYQYRLEVERDGGSSGYSNEVSANLDLQYILSGVAWAAQSGPEGVGWIKFNSAAEGGQASGSSIPYSVQVDKDGLVTGNAWADVVVGDRASYGWLSFHPDDLVGCPDDPTQTNPGPPCEARFNSGTDQFSGWAKFLAPEDFAADESSWDGWVKLRGTIIAPLASLDSPFSTLASLFDTSLFTKKPFSLFASLLDFATVHAQSSYGVQLGTCVDKECPLSGVAWGSEIVGWLAFGGSECSSCTVSADVINEPPEVVAGSVLIVAGGNWCVEEPYYTVQWDYSDGDNDSQDRAEIAFVQTGSDPNTGGTPDLEATKITTGTEFTRFTHHFSDPLGYLTTGYYDQTGYLDTDENYKPWVKVFDGFDWSPWVAGDTITTPTHYGPYVDYTWDPDPPSVGNFATTTDISIDRSSSGLSSWLWEFNNATPSPQTESSAHVFITSSTVDVALTVTDGLGDAYSSCTLTETKDVTGAALPIKRRIFRER